MNFGETQMMVPHNANGADAPIGRASWAFGLVRGSFATLEAQKDPDPIVLLRTRIRYRLH